MKTYDFVVKEQPLWYQFRWKVSNLLVRLAKKIYPENPEVQAFYLKLLSDYMIYGGAVTHINMSEMLKDEAKDEKI